MGLTASTDALYIQRLENCGAHGFVHTSTEGREIKTGLLKIMQGIKYKCAVIAGATSSVNAAHPDGTSFKDPGLCKREEEALICLLKKMNIKKVMEELGVSKPTIKQD